MLGMHGTFEANNAMHDCDLMIAIGARFDDRITGSLDAFSPGSKKIHVDIDPSSINKNVKIDPRNHRRLRPCAAPDMIDAYRAREAALARRRRARPVVGADQSPGASANPCGSRPLEQP